MAQWTQIGEYRNRVQVQERCEGTNDLGESVVTWKTVNTIWAAMRPLSGRELYLSQQVQADCTTNIIIRFNRVVTTKHRIIFRGRFFDIQSIVNVEERNREMILMCKEVV